VGDVLLLLLPGCWDNIKAVTTLPHSKTVPAKCCVHHSAHARGDVAQNNCASRAQLLELHKLHSETAVLHFYVKLDSARQLLRTPLKWQCSMLSHTSRKCALCISGAMAAAYCFSLLLPLRLSTSSSTAAAAAAQHRARINALFLASVNHLPFDPILLVGTVHILHCASMQ
jgi:hypothetical protein